MRDTIRRARFYAWLAAGVVLDRVDEAAHAAWRRVWRPVYRAKVSAFGRAEGLARTADDLDALDRWWGSPF